MKILITGGFGFIGGRVAQHLAKLGHQITLGTRNNEHCPTWLKTAQVAKTDWQNFDALAILCKDIDIIIHAAGINAKDSVLDPQSAQQFNSVTTGNLANIAATEGVKRFIYLSTAHVYSNPLRGAIDESTHPANKHPYALSHLEGEDAIRNVSLRSPIETIIARLSNIYGAPASPNPQCWSLLTNDLCKQAIEKGELHLNTNGNQMRDFLDMGTATEMLAFLCQMSISPEKSLIFNIGKGKSKSLLEMAATIQIRCQVNFGFTPEIYVNEKNISEDNSDLLFNVDRIRNAGFSSKENEVCEIDNLLNFCKRHF